MMISLVSSMHGTSLPCRIKSLLKPLFSGNTLLDQYFLSVWIQLPFQPGNENARLPIGARSGPGKNHLSKQVRKSPGSCNCQGIIGACPQMVNTRVLLANQESGPINSEICLPKAYISVYFLAIICRILTLKAQIGLCLKKCVKMHGFLHQIRKKDPFS